MKVKDDSVNIWGLQPEMQPVLKWADHVWEHFTDYELVVTDVNEFVTFWIGV